MPDQNILLSAANTLQLEVQGHSQRAYMSDALVFSRWLEDQELTIERIDYDAMVRYRAYLLANYAKSTASRRLTVARRLLGVAVNRNLIASNPAQLVENKISLDDSSPHTALSKREAKRLLAAVDTSTPIGKRDYALLMLLVYTGVRRSECAAIKLQDITSKQEHKVLTIQHGKGNKRRDIPLRPDVFRAISAYLEAVERLNDNPANALFTGFRRGQHATTTGITDKQIENIVKAYAAKIGVTATPHDLRASAITYLIDTGAPIIQVQRLAGHQSPSTTERYYTRKLDLDNSPVYQIDLDKER